MDNRAGRTITIKRKTFRLGHSQSVVTLPSFLGIEPGTEVTITIEQPNKNN